MIQFDLEDWTEVDRDCVLAAIDDGYDIRQNCSAETADFLLDAVRRYRAKHGNFPHPGISCRLMDVPGIEPRDMEVEPFENKPVGWFEPRIAWRRTKQTVHAVRTLDGVTSILSSYAGAGLHTAKKWIEVAA